MIKKTYEKKLLQGYGQNICIETNECEEPWKTISNVYGYETELEKGI